MTELDYDGQMKRILQILNSTSAAQLSDTADDGPSLLEVLNPAVNSLAYLYVLLALAQCQMYGTSGATAVEVPRTLWVDPGGSLWQRFVAFFDVFDPRQVRYAGAEWRRALETVARSAGAAGKPLIAIRPIREAILRLDPTASTLTSNHVLFVRLCLEAKSYRAALPILDRNVTAFPPQHQTRSPAQAAAKLQGTIFITPASGLSDRLTHVDHLSYHLFGAMIYIGLKKWDRALELLRFVLSAPTLSAPSLIQIEAYKKWILVNLIYHGWAPRLPRRSASGTRSFWHACAPAYDNIADVFAKRDVKLLKREIDAAYAVWAHDCNSGLVAQVLEALPRFITCHLEKIYMTVSTRQMCMKVPGVLGAEGTDHDDPEVDLEQRLLSMIDAGDLRATLSHHNPNRSTTRASLPSTVLNFATLPSQSQSSQPPRTTPSTSTLASENTLAQIEAQIERVAHLSAQLKESDDKARLNRDYIVFSQKIHKLMRDSRSDENSSSGASTSTINADYANSVLSVAPSALMASKTKAKSFATAGQTSGFGTNVFDEQFPYQSLYDGTQFSDEDVMGDL